jgi:hypothetical protein
MPKLTVVDSNPEPSEGKVDYFAPSYPLMQWSNHQCQFSLLFDTFFIQDTTNSFSAATWPHQQANKSPSNTTGYECNPDQHVVLTTSASG